VTHGSPVRLFLDLGPLRDAPSFRRLWVGQSLSGIGSQMTNFAVSLQIYTLTRSSLAVGATGLAVAVPAVVFGLLGGSVADAVDRRKLVLVTGSLQAAMSVALAAQAFAGMSRVWPLYVLVALQSTASSIATPTRRTFTAVLLPPRQVPAGAALTSISFQASLIAGPALAGLVTAASGLKVCYLLDAISFSAALYGTGRLPAMPPTGGVTRPGPRAVAEAIRFAYRSKILCGALLTDLNATVLGMPFGVFPAINAAHFGGSTGTLGLLTAAPAIGGVLGTALSGPITRVSRQGRAQLVASAVWGGAVAAFGVTRALPLAVFLLMIAGAADVTNVVFRTSMVQLTTPDSHRGRVSAAEYVIGAGGSQLGNFRAGAVASLTSPATSALTGGLATVAGATLIALTLPAFTRYRARSHA